VFGPDDLAQFGKYVRAQLERSQDLAALAAEQPSNPRLPGSGSGPAWRSESAASVKRRLAVLEFRGSLSPSVLAVLSDQARAAAVEAIGASGFAVMI
jgi:hypothetical protein